MTKLSAETVTARRIERLACNRVSPPTKLNKLITDRAQILFPGSSGAVCVTANSRDLVEVVATWGEPSLIERFFSPKDCWALRRGRIHVLGGGFYGPELRASRRDVVPNAPCACR